MDNKPIANSFYEYLLKLKDDKAAMAELKRGIAFEPGTYTPMFCYITPFLSDNTNELPFFLTASLFAMHPLTTDEGNLGTSLRNLESSPSTELRFKTLLRCREEELSTQLRGVISLLASKGIPVNYIELFNAIKYWEHPDKFIQKKLAKSFWSPIAEKTNNN
jgi:CRISPR type I-E-associated protein CasB/Cse2